MENHLEQTLAIIKPDAIDHRNAIKKLITDRGFHITQSKLIHLTVEVASEFYRSHVGSDKYPGLVMSITGGPIEVLLLVRCEAIREFQCLIGPENIYEAQLKYPKTIRGRFGKRVADEHENVIHGSSDFNVANFEIGFFFPCVPTDPITTNDCIGLYLDTEIYPLLMDGLYKLAMDKPDNPILWLGEWLLKNNLNTPTINEQPVPKETFIDPSDSKKSMENDPTDVRYFICVCCQQLIAENRSLIINTGPSTEPVCRTCNYNISK